MATLTSPPRPRGELGPNLFFIASVRPWQDAAARWASLDLVYMLDGLVKGADRNLVKAWQKMNAKRFDNIMLKTKTVGARALPEGIG